MTKRLRFLLLCITLALGACGSGGSAVLDTLSLVWKRDTGVDRAPLNPAFRYLRVVVDGRVVLLALGDVDRDRHGPVEVWYSAEREVVRLQNGRVVGAAGLTTEWRNVTLPALPAWRDLVREPYRWERARDVMPGYRVGVRDSLMLRAVPPPGRTALRDLSAGSLQWFEEVLENRHDATELQLPPARYAVDLSPGREQVVYGEQCLSRELCFSWQRWPAASGG